MSATPEVMCLGCVPVVDNERTNAYVRWARQTGRMGPQCCSYVNLGFCDLDSPVVDYSNPIDDAACWYDPDAPESADFLGLFIVNVDGLENDNYTRGVDDVGGDGTVFTRPMRPGKVLTFDVMLLAASCCGMDYGRNWLANVLRGQGCAHGASRFGDLCGTTELKIRECCPSEGAADDGMRIFPTASLTQGLQRADNERRDTCCCNYKRYTFVVTTGTADSFGEPIEVCDQELDPDNYQCRDWNACVEVVEPEPCVDPLGCGDLYIEAFESPSLRDECYCPPLEQTRVCCCLDEYQSGSTERTIIIDLFAGQDINNPIFTRNGARNIEILIWENPKNLPCPATQVEFDYFRDNQPVCARVTVGYIPSAGQLRIDGRTGEAYIVCVGRKIPVYDGVEGDLKKLRTGCNPLIVCALFDRSNAVYPPESVTITPTRMKVSVARKFT